MTLCKTKKRRLAIVAVVVCFGLFVTHALGEGDAFQTAEVLLALIFFW